MIVGTYHVGEYLLLEVGNLTITTNEGTMKSTHKAER